MTKYANFHYSCINWCPWPTLLPLYLLVRIGAVWQLAFYSHDENKFDQIFNHIMKLEFFQKLNCVWIVLFFNGYWNLVLLNWITEFNRFHCLFGALIHQLDPAFILAYCMIPFLFVIICYQRLKKRMCFCDMLASLSPW